MPPRHRFNCCAKSWLVFAAALVFPLAAMGLPQSSYQSQDDTKRPEQQTLDQQQQTYNPQQQTYTPQQQSAYPSQTQTPEGVPSQTPTVILDDTHTLPTQKPSKPTEQVETLKTRTVELTDFQQMVATSLGQTLPIYGQSLFETVPTTFAPADRVPVSADYIIGPGDELLIRAWGQIDLDVHSRVDRNGAVYIPKVGNLNVAGLRYDQLQGFLKSHIGRIYQNFDLNVSMGELRSIDVYVVGQARRPGRYTISGLSTLTNAVFACGGPSPTGSMRHIQLKRGSTVVTEFDLYDLLLKGDRSKDVQLQAQDVMYFAPVGPQVAMGGEVNTPAIYELRNESTLQDALQLSGGLSTTAYGGKVYVEQIKDRENRSIEEIKLDASGLGRPLKDGDVLNFVPISPRFVNSVTLRGNVASPGRYPWHEGMRVTDLIPNREFLITRQYWNQQNEINLQMQAVGSRLTGQLNDVRRNAPEINWDYAVIQRISEKDLSTELIPFNLGKAVLNHEDASNLVLKPGDVVTIFSQADLRVPREQQTKLVRLEGEFVSAGIYRAQPSQGLRDLVASAGGLAPSAYLYAAVFTRESTRKQQQERLDMVIAQMERDLARQAATSSRNARNADETAAARATMEAQRANLEKLRQLKADGRIVLNLHPNDTGVQDIPDIPLEDGDELYVPSRPIVVSVVGDVYNQGSFLQREGKTVSRYLRDAGGPTRAADKSKIFVVRANGAVVSKDAASGFWSGGFESMVLMPGDTVVVPEQLNPGQALRNFKDWSQILFNFGLAAAAINVLK
ncbi:MAG TPA: SLBB domain-containing protein [Terriglobales bacterium]|nr:SLBB domain-containing protein [Terriglobales bacterium]